MDKETQIKLAKEALEKLKIADKFPALRKLFN